MPNLGYNATLNKYLHDTKALEEAIPLSTNPADSATALAAGGNLLIDGITVPVVTNITLPSNTYIKGTNPNTSIITFTQAATSGQFTLSNSYITFEKLTLQFIGDSGIASAINFITMAGSYIKFINCIFKFTGTFSAHARTMFSISGSYISFENTICMIQPLAVGNYLYQQIFTTTGTPSNITVENLQINGLSADLTLNWNSYLMNFASTSTLILNNITTNYAQVSVDGTHASINASSCSNASITNIVNLSLLATSLVNSFVDELREVAFYFSSIDRVNIGRIINYYGSSVAQQIVAADFTATIDSLYILSNAALTLTKVVVKYLYVAATSSITGEYAKILVLHTNNTTTTLQNNKCYIGYAYSSGGSATLIINTSSDIGIIGGYTTITLSSSGVNYITIGKINNTCTIGVSASVTYSYLKVLEAIGTLTLNMSSATTTLTNCEFKNIETFLVTGICNLASNILFENIGSLQFATASYIQGQNLTINNCKLECTTANSVTIGGSAANIIFNNCTIGTNITGIYNLGRTIEITNMVFNGKFFSNAKTGETGLASGGAAKTLDNQNNNMQNTYPFFISTSKNIIKRGIAAGTTETKVNVTANTDAIFTHADTDWTANPLNNDPFAICDVGFTATGGSTTTVVKAAAGWTVNQFKGFMVAIIFGTGIGELRRVLSNTADTLTVEHAFVATIDNTSVAAIYQIAENVILKNCEFISFPAAIYQFGINLIFKACRFAHDFNIYGEGATYDNCTFANVVLNISAERVRLINSTIASLLDIGTSGFNRIWITHNQMNIINIPQALISTYCGENNIGTTTSTGAAALGVNF